MKNEIDMYQYENNLYKDGYSYIAGCDEVGRGPMAGPLVTAAVILDKNNVILGLNDSKKLSPKKREKLAKIIKEKAIDYSITFISESDVDKMNVYAASRYGMIECVRKLKKVDYVLTDCMPISFEYPVTDIVKGDMKSASIAAASIIAKVARDNYMIEMAKIYPEYGFERHKGYVTKYHLEKLNEFGPSPIHRKSFAPVKKAIEK